MGGITPTQIIIVLAIALLIFGPAKLPDIARNVGKGVRELKDGITGDRAAVEAPEREERRP